MANTSAIPGNAIPGLMVPGNPSTGATFTIGLLSSAMAATAPTGLLTGKTAP